MPLSAVSQRTPSRSGAAPMRERDLLAILDAGPIGPEALASLSRERRQVAEAGIAALIAALDALDPDPEAEPSLGTPEIEFRDNGLPLARGHIDQRRWSRGAPRLAGLVDLEEDATDDEPNLGAPECNMSIRYGAELDRTCDQTSWARGWDTDEREHEDEHGGDILDERHDEEEDEPSLGAPEIHHDQRRWAQGDAGSQELDHDERNDLRALDREQRQALDHVRREAEAMLRKPQPVAAAASNVIPFPLDLRRAS